MIEPQFDLLRAPTVAFRTMDRVRAVPCQTAGTNRCATPLSILQNRTQMTIQGKLTGLDYCFSLSASPSLLIASSGFPH